MASYPKETRCVLRRATSPSSEYYFDPVLETRPVPVLKDCEVLVRLGAGIYPFVALAAEETVPGNDSRLRFGRRWTVVFAYHPNDPLLRHRVFLHPTWGWESDGPEESRLHLIGGVPEGGTFSEFVVTHRKHVFLVPDYLPIVHATAWPVGGVTTWRAITIKAKVKEGDNVLITGIGGGVAFLAMQLCLALGANVFVTSSSPHKIARAKELGAVDGVNYLDDAWPVHLEKLLVSNAKDGKRPLLDSIIDSAGGDICSKTFKTLKQSGVIVCYGMTAVPKIEFTMREVLRNVELKGSTLGSRKDLLDATAFIEKHQIIPEVSHVLRGLDEIHEGLRLLGEGAQFGKIVVKFPGREPDGSTRL